MGEEERIRIKVMGPMFGAFTKSTCVDCYEFVYDAACAEYDWLVVFDELPVAFERLRCPAENTILCTWEPVSIKGYSKAYTRQFGHLLTNRPPEAERHPHYHLGRGYFIPFVHDVPAPHHWSEKFADAILCECLPFYAGDPALTEIFPAESFIPIPIDDPDEAVRIVRAAIANDEYAKRREAILEAKRLIFEKYNFWSQVISVIESAPQSPRLPPSSRLVYARKELRWHSLSAALEDGWAHLRRFLGFDLV